MFKIILKRKSLFSRFNFSTVVNAVNQTQKLNTDFSIDVFPDQIVDNLGKVLENNNDAEWMKMESQILNKIHFFDRDQYCDVVTMIARADKGSEDFWDHLSKKIFDYELDIPQVESVIDSFTKTTKMEHFIFDPLLINRYVRKGKYPKELEQYRKLI